MYGFDLAFLDFGHFLELEFIALILKFEILG